MGCVRCSLGDWKSISAATVSFWITWSDLHSVYVQSRYFCLCCIAIDHFSYESLVLLFQFEPVIAVTPRNYIRR